MNVTTRGRVNPENFRVFHVLNSMCYLGLPAHAFFIPLFFWLGVPLLAWFNFLSVASWAFAAWLNRRGHHAAAINIVTAEVVAHAALATYCFGWGSGFQTYLMPMVTFTMINNRIRTRTMLAQAIGVVVIYATLYEITRDIVYPFSRQLIETAFFANVAIVFAALMIISFYYRRASLEAERRMEELASTDMLTHLPNRRRMRALIEEEFARFAATGKSFGIVLTDIDFFKKLNDAYGHDCGDFVLRSVSSRLREVLSEHQTVGRWGGEEFLAVLPESSLEASLVTAERMRNAIETETICFCGHDLAVTMTFGVAVAVKGESQDACITRADMALYQGKRQGRNRVSTSSEAMAATAS